MVNKLMTGLTVGLLTLGTTSISHATAVTFFGEDADGSKINSDIAFADFSSNFTDLVTEDFESGVDITPTGATLDFGTAGSATLVGNGSLADTADGGRWATSGTHYWTTDTGDFSIVFEQAASAFGFYGTDIGDGLGSLTISYTDGTFGSIDLNVPNSVPGSDGSVLFFGFYEDDITKAFTSITFANSSDADYFGFDDMSIANYDQISPHPVPEPATMLLFGCGLIGLAGIRMRR